MDQREPHQMPHDWLPLDLILSRLWFPDYGKIVSTEWEKKVNKRTLKRTNISHLGKGGNPSTQTCLFGKGYVCWFPGRFPQKTETPPKLEAFLVTDFQLCCWSLLSRLSSGTSFWVSCKAMDHQIYVDSTTRFSVISMIFCFPFMAIRATPNLSSVHAKRFRALCGTGPSSQTSRNQLQRTKGAKLCGEFQGNYLLLVYQRIHQPATKVHQSHNPSSRTGRRCSASFINFLVLIGKTRQGTRRRVLSVAV